MTFSKIGKEKTSSATLTLYSDDCYLCPWQLVGSMEKNRVVTLSTHHISHILLTTTTQVPTTSPAYSSPPPPRYPPHHPHTPHHHHHHPGTHRITHILFNTKARYQTSHSHTFYHTNQTLLIIPPTYSLPHHPHTTTPTLSSLYHQHTFYHTTHHTYS